MSGLSRGAPCNLSSVVEGVASSAEGTAPFGRFDISMAVAEALLKDVAE